MTPTKRLLLMLGSLFAVYSVAASLLLLAEWLLPWGH